MRRHLVMMASYNGWANRRLYDACGKLSDADFGAGLGAYFGSLRGTLNHLLVADRIWLARLKQEQFERPALDAMPFEQFQKLRVARETLDEELRDYVASLDETTLAERISYTYGDDRRCEQDRSSALAHVFNHQTHHRGQCHAMLTRLTGDAPALDLLFHQRETGEAAT